MNHSISPRELRRWHAWIDKPWPESKAEVLREAYLDAFQEWARYANGNHAKLHTLMAKMETERRAWIKHLRNPSRHDPRNGGL